MTVGLTRRRLLVASVLLVGTLGAARAHRAVPIADIHTLLGKQARAAMTLDLAADMKANHVVLAAWAYATDRAYSNARPDGLRQVSQPSPTEIAMAMREETASNKVDMSRPTIQRPFN